MTTYDCNYTAGERNEDRIHYTALFHRTDHRPDKSYEKGQGTDVPVFNYANTVLLIVC
jgi:hypothetical protein